MENWQTIILRMCDEGSSVKEIIEYFNQPNLINEAYVTNVIYSNTSAKWQSKRYWFPPQKSLPTSNTLSRKLYDKVQSIGGNEVFLELLSTKSLGALGREWGVPWYAIRDYRNIFIRGRWNNLQVRKKKRAKKTKLTVKDVRELW